ncbi:MAG: MBL fold metallo-hydrolase [Myxococcota bacterium]
MTIPCLITSTNPLSVGRREEGAGVGEGRVRGAGLSRRELLRLLPTVLPWLALARAGKATPSEADLRVCKIRHGTFLVELAGVQVLVDPCFARNLVSPLLGTSPPPARSATQLGQTRLVLVTSSSTETFSPRDLRSLVRGQPYCLAPDERVVRALRQCGLRRVRRVQAGDQVRVAGVQVRVSPRAPRGARPVVGYHLSSQARSLWFPGDGPSLDVDAGPIAFARDHTAEVMVARVKAQPTPGERATGMGSEDARLLTAKVGASFCIAAYDDVELTWLGTLLAGEQPRGAPTGPDRHLVPSVVERGVWYRVPKRTPSSLLPW